MKMRSPLFSTKLLVFAVVVVQNVIIVVLMHVTSSDPLRKCDCVKSGGDGKSAYRILAASGNERPSVRGAMFQTLPLRRTNHSDKHLLKKKKISRQRDWEKKMSSANNSLANMAHVLAVQTLDNKGVKSDDRNKFRTKSPPRSCNGCFTVLDHIQTVVDQPDVCKTYAQNHSHDNNNNSNHHIDLVFLIISAVSHVPQRHAIRRTWASVSGNNTDKRFRYVFMLGQPGEDAALARLQQEAFHFRDIVIHSFTDSYGNLTLKTLLSLRWVVKTCAGTRFFMKVDDDVWVNTGVMNDVLVRHAPFLQRALGGECLTGVAVERRKSHKWYVSEKEYPEKTFPPYCPGFAYASTVTVASQIVTVSRHVPFFHLEDVYVGMCLQLLGLEVKPFPQFLNFRNDSSCELATSPTGVPVILNVWPPYFHQWWSGKCEKGIMKTFMRLL